MSRSLRARLQHTNKNMFWNSIARTRKHLIKKFTDTHKLTYYGNINRDTCDCRIIRGFTASSTHADRHYSSGIVRNYIVSLVDRNDLIISVNDQLESYNWLIMAFRLRTEQDVPHLLLNAKNRDSKAYHSFFETYHSIKEVNLGTFEDYSSEFTSRYSLFSQPDMAISVEKLFPANSARVIGAHFWPLSAEVHDGYLYLYSDAKEITPNLLDVMLENGLWLASHIDIQAECI